MGRVYKEGNGETDESDKARKYEGIEGWDGLKGVGRAKEKRERITKRCN